MGDTVEAGEGLLSLPTPATVPRSLSQVSPNPDPVGCHRSHAAQDF